MDSIEEKVVVVKGLRGDNDKTPDHSCWRSGDKYVIPQGTFPENREQIFEAGVTGNLYQNWGRTYESLISKLEEPCTTTEVEVIIEREVKAYKPGTLPNPIRFVGAGHSWNPLSEANNGTLVMTKNIQPLSCQKTETDETVYTVPAGSLVIDIESKFSADRPNGKKGVCLPVTTVETTFSVAGIMGPGCHGSGKDTGLVCDMIKAMTLVTYNTEEDASGAKKVATTVFTKEDDKFRALMINLGALGPMVEMDIQTEENTMCKRHAYKTYEMKKYLGVSDISFLGPLEPPENFDDSKLRKMVEKYDYVDINWVPFTDRIFAIRIDKKTGAHFTNAKEEENINSFMLASLGYKASQILRENSLLAVRKFLGIIMMRELVRRRQESKIITLQSALHWETTCDSVACTDVEFAFPIRFKSDGVTLDFRPVIFAWSALICLLQKSFFNRDKSKKAAPVDLFGQIRFIKGSPLESAALLAPSIATDEFTMWCYIEALGFKKEDPKKAKLWEEFKEKISFIWMMCDPLAVPHWAKEFPERPASTDPTKSGVISEHVANRKATMSDILYNRLLRVYGTNLQQFAAVKYELDPIGFYSNQFIHWLLDDIDEYELNDPLITSQNAEEKKLHEGETPKGHWDEWYPIARDAFNYVVHGKESQLLDDELEKEQPVPNVRNIEVPTTASALFATAESVKSAVEHSEVVQAPLTRKDMLNENINSLIDAALADLATEEFKEIRELILEYRSQIIELAGFKLRE